MHSGAHICKGINRGRATKGDVELLTDKKNNGKIQNFHGKEKENFEAIDTLDWQS